MLYNYDNMEENVVLIDSRSVLTANCPIFVREKARFFVALSDGQSSL